MTRHSTSLSISVLRQNLLKPAVRVAQKKESKMSGEPKLSHEGLRVAELVKSGEGQDAAIERAPGIYESRGVGNSYLITTGSGDVLINAGTLGDARRGRELFSKISRSPIRYIILTQSH